MVFKLKTVIYAHKKEIFSFVAVRGSLTSRGLMVKDEVVRVATVELSHCLHLV